jgi:hypothetical protein
VLTGVRLGGFSRPGPDLVESFHDLSVELHRQRAEIQPQLLGCRRSDDRGGEDGIPQQPRRLYSEVRPMKWHAEAAHWARARSQPAKLLLPT